MKSRIHILAIALIISVIACQNNQTSKPATTKYIAKNVESCFKIWEWDTLVTMQPQSVNPLLDLADSSNYLTIVAEGLKSGKIKAYANYSDSIALTPKEVQAYMERIDSVFIENIETGAMELVAMKVAGVFLRLL